jgi:hypothetical protein
MGGAAAVATIAEGCGDNVFEPSGSFFDAHQWETIDIATGIILPSEPDGQGARDALAVRYIDQLLAAFYVLEAPTIFGGGPFSGRTPFPDDHGQPTAQFPSNAFVQFIQPSRVRNIAWRMRILGSANTPGGDFNDGLQGPTLGLQAQYLDGIQRLDEVANMLESNAHFRTLSPADQRIALATVASDKPDFWQALVEHTLEGTFGAPEYGGNQRTIGWKLAQYDGDSAPLGHSYYDESIGAYVDRADQPTSVASPGATSEDFDSDVLDVLTIAAIGSGGKRFF